MRIGFDAKRAFHNGTGLGHYSRTLLHSLSDFFPEHEYFLFNPKKRSPFAVKGEHLREVNPSHLLHRAFPSAWRSSWVKTDLHRLGIDLYHGLSHEVPVGIRRTGIRSVVTIHDLIHERYPEQYNPVDVRIYRKKFRHACGEADAVIAISRQTRDDIIQFYGTDPGKISVCYQSCNPAFAEKVSEASKDAIRRKYGLPSAYFLYVGSIIERKNLLNICRAMLRVTKETNLPLVVIGDGGAYKKKVRQFVDQHQLGERVIFLSEKTSDPAFLTATDFPAIYQSATTMIYPSFFEGFGIPVLEALWAGLPVITSNVSCLPEVGGDAPYYVDPAQPEQIAEGMLKMLHEPRLAEEMREKGFAHARQFSQRDCAAGVMEVYLQTMNQ